MNSQNSDLSFFIASSELTTDVGRATVVVDTDVILSVDEDDCKSLGVYERKFISWFKEFFLSGFSDELFFVVDPEILDVYDQDLLCKEILLIISGADIDTIHNKNELN